MTDRMTIRIRALKLVLTNQGLELRGATKEGWRHLGAAGGDHVIRCPRGRLFRVDLVTETVALCVGLAPKVVAW